MAAAEFRGLLEAGDVTGLRRFWDAVFPGMPQPKTYLEAEQVMHTARTAAESVGFQHRAYSYAWLRERALPDQLPDHLKPSAERLYPRIVEGVGISVNFRAEWLKPAKPLIEKVMQDAVLEAAADGKLSDAPYVKARMAEARAREQRALFGRGDSAAPTP